VYMVMLSGYANTVSRISVHGRDRPKWLDKLDMGGLKLKLFASIIAISAVQVLRMFMQLSGPDSPSAVETPSDRALWWSVGIHGVFVLSGLLVAATDWIASKGRHDRE
ncbi:MAG: YqhA family protein, partial [Phycisphaerales bacterium]